ncbi:hypothetical protein [Granulicella tundricola]|uniref:Uncharacterized protein n=1 Tax=Granulicella tundricola (strain ATCC BAA-1859 / DSM 23138 / MP5ACTX9) TaxID=1198114 RepID=E8X5J4_GRATM|nr:hypothetical protein [Granulicella tundricola]ADW70621.1 hypothetical protein AciX9_3618 [Granulicella tundricola MP5ACTX9]
MSLSPTTVPRNTIPSSLRKPIQSTRISPSPYRSAHATLLTNMKSEARTAPAALKSRFSLMPKESEDAKITGSTRSLERRLLALNLSGSRMARINPAA